MTQDSPTKLHSPTQHPERPKGELLRYPANMWWHV